MAELITRELMNGGLTRTFKTVELRSGDYAINVRGLSIDETIKFVELRDVEGVSERDKLDAMITLALLVCVDADGKQLFDSDNREAVMQNFTASDLAVIVEAAADVEAQAIEGKPEASSDPTA